MNQPADAMPPFAATNKVVEASAAFGARASRASLSEAAKTAFDVILAGIALLAVSPLMIIIALAIRITSPGPALFRQTRVGYLGAPFVMFKFRTMYEENDDAIHRDYVTKLLKGDEVPYEVEKGFYKLSDDPRVTPVGAFLRRASLDELPQLFNVLLGTMSLVGPRPALPWEAELFKPEYAVRFSVKPGITGLWQVSGRSKLPVLQALKLDVEYVERRSLALDLRILLKTIPAVLMAREAA